MQYYVLLNMGVRCREVVFVGTVTLRIVTNLLNYSNISAKHVFFSNVLFMLAGILFFAV